MKVLVAVKRVIDYNAKVRVASDHSNVDLANIKMSINPFCEIAVEEAVKLKEAGIATEVIAVSIGPDPVIEQIRSALALGADRGVQVKTDEMPESLSVAKLLAKIAEKESAELVLLGKQAIDSDNNQTGQMLAALLDWPQGTFISNLDVDSNQENKKVTIKREIDGGLQDLSFQLPAVVTVDLRLNEPRYVALPNIMKAKRKPIEAETPEALGVSFKTHTKLLKVTPPAERKAGIKVNSVDELLEKLRSEANVL